MLDIYSKKDIFLFKLKSKSGKYKRYLGSPLRYAGGKSWAVGYIIEHLPENLKCVVSPFLGGASLEIAIAKELQIPVIGFDIFYILVNYWYHQINYPEHLYSILSKLTSAHETYEFIKQKLLDYWKNKIDLEPLLLAAYYYYNHNLSYGPGFLGWLSKVYANQKTYNNMINRVKNFKVDLLQVYSYSFEDVIPNHPNDFLYCAPHTT